MEFRNSIDRWIFDNIFYKDEYQLDKYLKAGDIVLDIGLHAGYFAYTALVNGANFVYGYEMDEDNFNLSKRNLSILDNKVAIYNNAVWRSDIDEDERLYEDYPIWADNINHGGIGIVLNENKGSKKTKTVKLDDIIDEIIRKKYRLDILKVDAESSEWHILLTSNKLNRVRTILGEFHEIGGKFDNNDPKAVGLELDKYDIKLLKNYLRENHGFNQFLYNRYTNLNIGHFWATKDK